MAWPYGWFAERYGWHPLIVDQIPLSMLLQWPTYASAVDEAKAIRRREAEDEAERAAAQAARLRG